MWSTWLSRIKVNLVLLFSLYADNGAKRLLRKLHNFRGSCHFDDLSHGSDHLVIVVAGYKEPLWDEVFRRIRNSVPSGWDVCICCPGVDPPKLRDLCKTNQWSYLATKENKLSLAQNMAISRHSKARVIIKLDEDIVVTESSLTELSKALAKASSEGPFKPGLVAPLINVNGFTSRILLEKLKRLEEYESKLGPCVQSCVDTNVWKDPEAARFLWKIILPFDQMGDHFAQEEMTLVPCPFRFSIGCFAMERRVWESMGGFSTAPEGVLGLEEIDLAAYCSANALPILVADNILVGHVGFGHQTPLMTKLILDWIEKGLLSRG